MLKFILAFALLVAASEAKTRRGPLPQNVWQKLKHLPQIDEKIVGGDEVEPNSIPYQVSFQTSDGFHFCGGIVFDKFNVITAAHCCTRGPNQVKVIAGKHNLEKVEENEQERKVEKVLQHEDYGSNGFEFDICLLHLEEAFDLNDYVAGVSMPEQNQDWEADSDAIVSGWGTLSSGGSSPDTLHAVTVPVVSDESCRGSYGQSDITDSMICSGEEGKDSCQGDSGGPMTCGGKLCGIVSWGRVCALAGYPGVYTQASYYVKWINDNKKE